MHLSEKKRIQLDPKCTKRQQIFLPHSTNFGSLEFSVYFSVQTRGIFFCFLFLSRQLWRWCGLNMDCGWHFSRKYMSYFDFPQKVLFVKVINSHKCQIIILINPILPIVCHLALWIITSRSLYYKYDVMYS